MNIFNMPLDKLDGIGPKRVQAFSKLNINSVYQLLMYFPYKYQDRSTFCSIEDLGFVTECCVRCVAVTPVKTYYPKKNMSVSSCKMADETGEIKVSWFNQPYMSKSISVDKEYILFGKFIRKGNVIEISNPVIEKAENLGKFTGKIVPVYSLVNGVSQTVFSNAILQSLKVSNKLLPDAIPELIRNKYNIENIENAIGEIHFPTDYNNLTKARKRFLFEQYFMLFVLINKVRRNSDKVGIRFNDLNTDEFESNLPFGFTEAQKRVVEQFKSDFSSGICMKRLVQGDVGSGKTAVAATAVFMACKNGYQSVVMAPTEILARQHYESFKKMLPTYKIGLLTSSCTKKERENAVRVLEEGKIDVLIGTHAVIEDYVKFKNLGLVVCDEQHRFGVKQRQKLIEKGNNPHLIVMTATPIPRTLSLILYGDLSISIIDELPPGRTPVKTYLVNESYRNRVYTFLEKQLHSGGQAYIICPLVDESKTMALKDATNFSEYVSKKLPDYSVGLLHGKMKDSEKDEVMARFKNGDIRVLVSTTVVEVGVDVPNACLIIIENAERFGLSQLHQLRGRVGRGITQSYCIVFGNTKNEKTFERLKIFEKSNDGFYISEQDLKMRGPGDFVGTRQSGIPSLASVDGEDELKTVYDAKSAAELFFENQEEFSKKEIDYIDFISDYSENKENLTNILN